MCWLRVYWYRVAEAAEVGRAPLAGAGCHAAEHAEAVVSLASIDRFCRTRGVLYSLGSCAYSNSGGSCIGGTHAQVCVLGVPQAAPAAMLGQLVPSVSCSTIGKIFALA